MKKTVKNNQVMIEKNSRTGEITGVVQINLREEDFAGQEFIRWEPRNKK